MTLADYQRAKKIESIVATIDEALLIYDQVITDLGTPGGESLVPIKVGDKTVKVIATDLLQFIQDTKTVAETKRSELANEFQLL